MRKLLPLILIGLLCVGAKDYQAEVVRVLDGDTFYCRIETWPGDFKEISVRVYGIDTPEKEFPLGAIVKKYAQETIPTVASKAISDRYKFIPAISVNNVRFDKYGRALGDVDVPGIGDWRNHMIEKGYAKPYEGGNREGLWKDCQLQMVTCE